MCWRLRLTWHYNPQQYACGGGIPNRDVLFNNTYIRKGKRKGFAAMACHRESECNSFALADLIMRKGWQANILAPAVLVHCIAVVHVNM